MCLDWLREPLSLPAASGSTVGVAIAVSDPERDQLHIGVLHAHDYPPEVLHLSWHFKTDNDRLPHDALSFWWVELDLPADRSSAVAGLCRRIIKRVRAKDDGHLIPYGLIYRGGRFRSDGRVEFAAGEIGLTCATFVLAVLSGAGIGLLDLPTWPERPQDLQWHAHIVRSLRETKERRRNVSDEHIAGVEREAKCARYRPAEIAAACSLTREQIPFDDVESLGAGVASVLLAYA
jgi:hypothetical protein